MRRLLAFACTTWLLSACPAALAMDITNYEKQRKEPATSPTHVRLRVYLLCIGEGFRLANIALGNRNEPLLYCAPEQATLNVDSYKAAIDAAILAARDAHVRQDRSVESLLLEALQEKYACPPVVRSPSAQETAPRP